MKSFLCVRGSQPYLLIAYEFYSLLFKTWSSVDQRSPVRLLRSVVGHEDFAISSGLLDSYQDSLLGHYGMLGGGSVEENVV
jgi:hypothetical protein